MKSLKILSVLFVGATLVSGALAIAAEPKPLQSTGVDWDKRAEKWFKSEDEKDRKAQMKEASRALKRPCKNCHTEDFEGFVDEDRKLLTQQMMAVAAEHGVECKDCHAGKDKLTELGDKTEKWYDVSREKKLLCEDCHQQNKSKFADLTDAGKKYKDEMAAKGATPAPAAPAAPSAPVSAP